MKFVLISDKNVLFRTQGSGELEGSSELDYCQISVDPQSRQDGADPEKNKQVEDLLARIRLLDQTHKLWNVAFRIPYLGMNKKVKNIMEVTITCTLFQQLQGFLHQEHEEQGLTLALLMTPTSPTSRYNQYGDYYDINTSHEDRGGIEALNFRPFIQPHLEVAMSVYHHMYTDCKVVIPAAFLQLLNPQSIDQRPTLQSQEPATAWTPRRFPEGEWYFDVVVTLDVDMNDFFPMDGLLSEMVTVNRKILKDERSCDITIITKEGSVKCHRMFLTGNSPVFGAMFADVCKESQTNTVEIKDMSDMTMNGLVAFLEYLYFRGLTKPNKDPKVALEMFQAAEKYGVEPLKQTILRMFLWKSNEWYNLDMALNLYVFIRNLDGMDKLKEKIIEIINLNKADLAGSVLYKDEAFTKDICLELMTLALKNRGRESSTCPGNKIPGGKSRLTAGPPKSRIRRSCVWEN